MIREEKIEQAKVFISEITLLSTCLMNSLDGLLELRVEGKPLARQKLKHETKRLLDSLKKTVDKQQDFYGDSLINHMNETLESVEKYAEIFTLSTPEVLNKLLETVENEEMLSKTVS